MGLALSKIAHWDRTVLMLVEGIAARVPSCAHLGAGGILSIFAIKK
jgi:hypothetical protein